MGLATALAGLKVRAEVAAVKFWNDDAGAVISTEYVLVGGVLVAGVVPGLVAARDSINRAYVNMGNAIVAAVPQATFSGLSLGGTNGHAVAAVNGIATAPVPAANYLQASAVAPIPAP